MTDVVQKLWGFCNTLRHDGINYGDYIEQLTYLLFLKLANEKDVPVPDGFGWASLLELSGTDLTDHYQETLRRLGREKELLGAIFAGTAALVAQVAKTIFGAELESASAAVAALTVAALFQPLRDWVEGSINRRLFPENIDMAKGLVEIQPEMWAWIPLPGMLQAALRHLEDIYVCESSAIYLKRGAGFQPAAMRGLAKSNVPVYRPAAAELNALFQKKTVASENEKPFVLTVPVFLARRKEAELLGVLRLGKRKEGRGYSGDDARTLVAFGAKLAQPVYALSLPKKR